MDEIPVNIFNLKPETSQSVIELMKWGFRISTFEGQLQIKSPIQFGDTLVRFPSSIDELRLDQTFGHRVVAFYPRSDDASVELPYSVHFHKGIFFDEEHYKTQREAIRLQANAEEMQAFFEEKNLLLFIEKSVQNIRGKEEEVCALTFFKRSAYEADPVHARELYTTNTLYTVQDPKFSYPFYDSTGLPIPSAEFKIIFWDAFMMQDREINIAEAVLHEKPKSQYSESELNALLGKLLGTGPVRRSITSNSQDQPMNLNDLFAKNSRLQSNILIK